MNWNLLFMDEKSLQASLALFKDILADLSDFLSEINKHEGSLSLPNEFIDILLLDDLPGWANLYEDFNLMKGVVGISLLGEHRVKALASEIKGLSHEELIQRKNELKYEILEKVESGELDNFGDIDGLDGLEGDDLDAFLKGSEHHRKAIITNLTTFLPHIFYYLSLMTHGENIVDLIKKAKNGDDDAFCKAIQIDRTLIYEIPYFRERVFRAQLSDDRAFLNDFSTHFKGKIFGHKLSYPKLWLLFAILEDEGFLDIPLDRLLNVCEQAGVYGKNWGVNDTNTLSKRRREYKRKRGTLI